MLAVSAAAERHLQTAKRYAMSWRGLLKRLMSPSSATSVPAGSRSIRDLAVLAHVVPPARLGKRDPDRFLVHVKAYICDKSVQDPSPYA